MLGNRVCCDIRRRPAGRPWDLPGFCGRRIGDCLGRTVIGLDLSRPKFGRVRIETEDELTLSFFNEYCEAVAKGLMRSLDQPPLTVCLSFAPAENFGTLLALIWIVSPVCGLTP